MAEISVTIQPGCTNLAARTLQLNNWRECNLVRWDNGSTLRPVGGWEKYTITAFSDRVRKIHKWSDNFNNMYVAFLCESHVYVEINGVISEITPTGGMVTPTGNNGGYGDFTYNYSTYGTARPGENRLRLYTPVYSLDNWGQDLLIMTSHDGRLLKWSPTAPATRAAAVTNAPTSNRSFVVTPEHHVMLFGMGGEFDKFGWCDQEDITDWVFTDVNGRAGFFNIEPKSPIVATCKFEGGTVIWTPAQAFLIEHIGLPYVYKYTPIGHVPIPLTGDCALAVPDGVLWFSIDGFWLFDGVRPRPMPCPVWDYITRRMDVNASRFCAAGVNIGPKGEAWFFFASLTDAPNGQNSRYVMYDYRANLWAMGLMKRTCGFSYANDRYPIMSDGSLIWKHEIGFKYPSASELPWIETGNLAPDNGIHLTTIKRIRPDVMGNREVLRFNVAKMNDRSVYSGEYYTTPRSINSTGWVDIRETARDMRLRISVVTEGYDWSTVGPLLFDGAQRGKK